MSTMYSLAMSPGSTNLGWTLRIFPLTVASAHDPGRPGYDAEAVASILGCAPKTVQAYWRKGLLRCYRAGKSRYSTADDIREFQAKGGDMTASDRRRDERRRTKRARLDRH